MLLFLSDDRFGVAAGRLPWLRRLRQSGKKIYQLACRRDAGEDRMNQIRFLEPRADIVARRDEIRAGLAGLVPADCLVTEERELVPFETDAFTAYRRVPLAVVLPETTEQVAAVMKYLLRKRRAGVPRGAGTSLAGGAIPQEDAVVIGVSKMTRMLESITRTAPPRCRPASPICASPTRSPPTVSSTRPTRPRSSPAPSAAISA
jgi:hypothetical protein